MNNMNGFLYTDSVRDTDPNPLTPEEIETVEDERLKMLEDLNVDESAVIAEIHKNIGAWDAYYQENNTIGRDDVEFLYRDQWTDVERSQFDLISTPALVVNKLYDPVRKIIAEQRDNTPEIKLRSLTGKATQESINLHTDMVKRICYASNSKEVYQTAFHSAMTFSYGAFLIDTEYESADTFRKEIIMRPIHNPKRCFFDPRAMKSHKGDGNYCGFRIDMSEEEFKATYPNEPMPTPFADIQSMTSFQWYSRDVIVLCEYWVKEYFDQILYKLADGSEMTKDEYDAMVAEQKQALKGFTKIIAIMTGQQVPNYRKFIPDIVDERLAPNYRIMHYRCTGNKVLEAEKWPSKLLPMAFVAGETYYQDGQEYTQSFIAKAKDAQRQVNYIASDIAGRLKKGSRGQWLGTPGNVVGPLMEQQWKNPETQMGILLAVPDPTKGGDPMPTYLPPAEIPQSLFIHYQRATADIGEVLGVHDEQMGAANSVVAQKTVMQRALQSSKGASVFFDNLNRAVEYGAKVVLDMMPAVYDTERTLTLTRANGNQYTVTINEQLRNGQVRNKIENEGFDVEVEVGPSFGLQKLQALEILVQLVQASPQVFPLVADLIAKNLDVQFQQQLSERFKTIVPPQILAKEEGRQPPPQQPNPDMIRMQKEMQIADAKIAAQQQDLQIKQERLVMDKERAELDRAELMLRFQQLQHEMQKTAMDDGTENKKAILSYSAKISQIIAAMQKGNNNQNS